MIRRFFSDEAGGATIGNLFFMFTMLAFSGVAIDTGYAFMERAMLQATADSAATAAVLDLPDADAARATARAYAHRNMPEDRFGAIVSDGDVLIGRWDPDEKTFIPDEEDPTTVVVTLHRSEETDNPAPTFLFRMLGLSHWDIEVAAIASMAGDGLGPCHSGGFLSNTKVFSDDGHDYADGFCIYAGDKAMIGSYNFFEPGATIMSPDLSTFLEHGMNEGVDEALREGELILTLPGLVPGLIAEMQAGVLSRMPPEILRVEHLNSIGSNTVLESGTLYIVKGQAIIPADSVLRDIAIVAKKKIVVGPNSTIRNAVLASSDWIDIDPGPTIGRPDICEHGVFDVYLFAEKKVELQPGGDAVLNGVQVGTQGNYFIKSDTVVSVGMHAEADKKIQYRDDGVWRGCETPLASRIADGAGLYGDPAGTALVR